MTRPWGAPSGAPMDKSTVSARLLSVLLALFTVVFPACAGHQKTASAKELRDTSESFARRLRWGDFKGMAQFIVPEQRLSYVKGILDRGDDETLKILDFELEHVQYLPDRQAIVLARVSWYRLPSVTAQSEVVSLVFEDRDGQWLVCAVENGPLPFEKIPRPKEDVMENEEESLQRL